MIATTDASICSTFVLRYLVAANEETCIGPLDIMDSLEEATKFIGKALLSNWTVGVGLDEVTIFEDVSCDVVDNGTNEIEGIGKDWISGFSDDTIRVFDEGLCDRDIALQ